MSTDPVIRPPRGCTRWLRSLLAAAVLALPTILPAQQAAASARPSIPATPVGRQVRWALDQLARRGTRPTPADVRARFSPEFLRLVMPARAVAAGLLHTTATRGPLTFAGFAFPPSRTKAIAIVHTRAGERGSVRVQVAGRPSRITRFEIAEAPPRMPVTGRYSGSFDIGGRRLFLRCTGTGTPTVVFQGGLTTDWVDVQRRVSRVTRACSYDPANALWGRSDDAPTPRTARDVVRDLHALLTAARVPGPYVLAGHSDGGLFAQLYALRHPRAIRGLVLIDAVHSDYYARRIALIRRLLPPAAAEQLVRALRHRPPPILDPEQIDIGASQAQVRAALASHPMRPMPLYVLTRDHPDAPESDPVLARADEELWRTLQDELATLVPRSRHEIAAGSGHDIQHDRPDVVVHAIRAVVTGVRDPGSWISPTGAATPTHRSPSPLTSGQDGARDRSDPARSAREESAVQDGAESADGEGALLGSSQSGVYSVGADELGLSRSRQLERDPPDARGRPRGRGGHVEAVLAPRPHVPAHQTRRP